jgi:putative ABC transport system permease protein
MAADRKTRSPGLARRLLKLMSAYRIKHSIVEDFEDTFFKIRQSKGCFRAKRWYWANTLKSVPEYLKVVAAWRLVFLKNHLKIAYRNLLRRKLFSFINIFGLAVGLSICFIIFLWVRQELDYDRFHENADRLYRVERRILRDNLDSRWPITGGAYRQALLDDFPEVEDATRLWQLVFSVKDFRKTVHEQDLCAVDNSIFNMFDFGLEEGDERTALTEPMAVVLTRKNALKYFGTGDAVGKSLPFEWNDETVDFKVTGILKPVPDRSHIHFDMLMSIASFPEQRFANWRSNYLYTYVLLKQGTSKMELEERFKGFVQRHLAPEYGDLQFQITDQPEPLRMVLFPITDIHLRPSFTWEAEPGGSINSVYVFSTIALFILVLACVNFINLSTAQAGKRAKEVSLRKTIGAGMNQLRGQFIQESVLSALASLTLAFILCSLLIPLYNQFFAQDLSIPALFQTGTLLLVIGITLLVGVLSGLYPAFYLTRFDPIRVLKGGLQSGNRKSNFRRNMVIFQFVVSTILIFGVFIVYNQMAFIQSRSLGFDKDNLIVIQARSQGISQGYNAFRSELLQNARIESVSASFDLPGDPFFSNGDFYNREESEEFIDLIRIRCGFDYVDNLKMDILAGRGFSREFTADAGRTILLNEAAVKKIGWTPEEAVGKKLDRGGPELEFQVVGVVRDFNFKSLRREVEPAAIMLFPDEIRTVSVRILPGDLEHTLGFIRQKWESTFPGEQFEFGFLDNRIQKLYEREQSMRNIFVVFTSLSILVACLGLFGLATFMAEVRTKEIGIRKTLGASSGSVTFLLSREFIKWILLANVVAWPAAYYLMNRWLTNFAYRIKIGVGVFILSVIILVFVSLGTIVVQTLRAALANPVDALRYE